MANPVVLIDSLNLAYRMHWSHLHLSANGKKTGVTYGMLRSILDIQNRVGTCDLIWFWEGGLGEGGPKIVPWRKKLAGDYKAGRKNPDRAEIMRQADEVKKILQVLGYAQFYIPGIEADDLIGVVSQKLSHDDDGKVYIITTDKDMYQCITDNVTILRPGAGRLTPYGARNLQREFGVNPDQWAAYKALVGDSSDHYKGVPGIGPSTAPRMLADGIDPSLAHFSDNPKAAREKYAKIKSSWGEATKCYELSYIPRSITFKHFEPDTRATLKNQLKQLAEMRKRTIPKSRYQHVLDQWTQFCSERELATLLVERRKFFASARIV